MTVTATGDASLPYTNSILERWNAEGLKTAEEIDASIERESEARAKQKGAKTKAQESGTLGNSFDTDDYFEAALKRSFRQSMGDESSESSKS